jgi:hypothetical protein
MDKFNWMTVLELLVAGAFAGIVIAILSGPLHRMAAHIHGHLPDGRAYRAYHEYEHDNRGSHVSASEVPASAQEFAQFEGHFERKSA